MWISILSLVIFLGVLLLVVDVRAQQLRRRAMDIPDNTVSSFFSRGLAELVGIAGGIYLSLVMLVSFLDVQIPDKIEMLGISFEPLALVSVIIALIQPFFLEIYEKIKS